MNIILLYLLKSALSMSGLYLVFRTLMRKQTFFQLNRVILLSIVGFSIIIPLVHLPQTMQPVVSFQLAPVTDKIEVYDLNLPAETAQTKTEVAGQPVKTTSPQFTFSWPKLLQMIYFSGLFVAVLVSLIGFLNILLLFRKVPVINKDGFRLLVAPNDIPAFSLGRYLFISKSDFETNGDTILTHEKAHIRHGHFYDLLLLELVKIIYWFNPVIYWLTRDLKAVHEFQADDSTLNYGIDALQYQLLIIQKGVGHQKFALANSFNHCQIKNRIVMMNKQKSNNAWRWKAAAFLPMLAVMLIFCGGKGSKVPVDQNKQLNRLDTIINGKRLIVKDTTQYASSFIKQLKEAYRGYEALIVKDDSLIIRYRMNNSRRDTIVLNKFTIPTTLELNKEIVFSTRNKDTSLVLKRTNYTNIEYQVKNEKKTIKAGTAILQGTFYFAASMYHDENGKETVSRQYLNLTSDLDWALIEVEIYQAKIASITYCVDPKANKFETLSKLSRE